MLGATKTFKSRIEEEPLQRENNVNRPHLCGVGTPSDKEMPRFMTATMSQSPTQPSQGIPI